MAEMAENNAIVETEETAIVETAADVTKAKQLKEGDKLLQQLAQFADVERMSKLGQAWVIYRFKEEELYRAYGFKSVFKFFESDKSPVQFKPSTVKKYSRIAKLFIDKNSNDMNKPRSIFYNESTGKDFAIGALQEMLLLTDGEKGKDAAIELVDNGTITTDMQQSEIRKAVANARGKELPKTNSEVAAENHVATVNKVMAVSDKFYAKLDEIKHAVDGNAELSEMLASLHELYAETIAAINEKSE